MLTASLITQTSLFAVASIGLWWGTGIVVDSIHSLARSLRISAFTISFFILGIMTSLPEFTIGLNSLYRGEPQIAIGNLVGATLIIFLLVIPLLAIVSRGVALPRALHRNQLILALITILTPTFLVADGRLGRWEGILLISMYLLLFIFLSRRESLYEKIVDRLIQTKNSAQHRLLKIGFGFGLIIVASNYMVSVAQYYASTFNWSPFLVGLIIVAIGTNIPEISLVIRAALAKKTEIALADYVGSASANALIIGMIATLSPVTIVLPSNPLVRMIILIASLLLFYIFIRSNKMLARREALLLLLIYVIFLVIEISQA